jgi:hypothetical protein
MRLEEKWEVSFQFFESRKESKWMKEGVCESHYSFVVTTHMYRLYDGHAVFSSVPPHCCEFELRVDDDAAVG